MSENGDDSIDDLTVQKITYFRQVKAPTLKQFLVRKAFGEQASETRGLEGVSPDEDRVLPESAIEMRKNLKGLTADEIAEKRPEWVDEYERRYSK